MSERPKPLPAAFVEFIKSIEKLRDDIQRTQQLIANAVEEAYSSFGRLLRVQDLTESQGQELLRVSKEALMPKPVAEEPVVKHNRRSVTKLVESFGGMVESDGVGGFDAIAPDGYVWFDNQMYLLAFPLNEYSDKDKRQKMINDRYAKLSRGIKKK